ncbi:MAG TPA: DHA2 family efflux MFS transporter permease subunit [Rhizomicrobium sp.]|nr:DHA2 family efflux MFS transporter permease subunit [Rhizomicrobium sp.]
MAQAIATSSADPEAEPLKMQGASLAAAIFVLSLATFIVILDTTIINVAIPHIAGAYAAATHEGTWAITSYAVAEAFTVPLSGWLVARFGVVRTFMVSIVGFAIFSMLCGMASSLEMLVVFRVFQGLCGGPLMPASQTLIMRVTPSPRVELAMGLWMMTTILAPIAGPILGGTLADTIGWRWAFYINIPIAMLCAFGAWALFRDRESKTSIQPIDFVGLVLLAVWVGALQIMLDNGQNWDWFASPGIIALCVTAVLGFAAFIVWELTDDHPVVDLRVFRHRGFWVSAAAMSFTFGAFFAAIVLMPLWLQVNLGYTSTLSGYVLAFQAVFGVIVAPLAAILMTKIDSRVIMSAGLAILAAALLYRGGYALNISFDQMILPQLAMGIGIPLFFVPLMTLSMTSVNPEETAAASGLINFLRTIAGAIATAVVISLWSSDIVASRVNLVNDLERSQDFLARLGDKGLADNQALGSLDALVQGQSVMLATNHVFVWLGLVIAATAAGIWLMPKPAAP